MLVDKPQKEPFFLKFKINKCYFTIVNVSWCRVLEGSCISAPRTALFHFGYKIRVKKGSKKPHSEMERKATLKRDYYKMNGIHPLWFLGVWLGVCNQYKPWGTTACWLLKHSAMLELPRGWNASGHKGVFQRLQKQVKEKRWREREWVSERQRGGGNWGGHLKF